MITPYHSLKKRGLSAITLVDLQQQRQYSTSEVSYKIIYLMSKFHGFESFCCANKALNGNGGQYLRNIMLCLGLHKIRPGLCESIAVVICPIHVRGSRNVHNDNTFETRNSLLHLIEGETSRQNQYIRFCEFEHCDVIFGYGRRNLLNLSKRQ